MQAHLMIGKIMKKVRRKKMGEHREKVIRHAKLLLAEEWANGIKGIHVFDTTKCRMGYDTHPKDGRVTDTEYNDGRIERTKNGKVIRVFGENALTGDMLISQWERFAPNTDLGL